MEHVASTLVSLYWWLDLSLEVLFVHAVGPWLTALSEDMQSNGRTVVQNHQCVVNVFQFACMSSLAP